MLQALIGCNVNEIRSWKSVLSDENGNTVAVDFSQEFCRFALQSGYEFGTHEVSL